MSEIKVSIIMPVYNAEKYLRETLESVKNQSFKDFELVVVNDGSTDSSENIISEFINDINIRIINQKNSGVSTARNVGIEESCGKYIVFLDADDIIHPDFLAVMHESIIKQDADMVFCEYIPFYGTCKFNQITDFNITLEEIKSDQNKAAFDYMMEIGLGAALWNKMIKKSIITEYNIQFNPDSSFGEDMFFNWKLSLVAEKIIRITKRLYGYRQNIDGATFRYHNNLVGNYLNEYNNLRTFCKQLSIDELQLEKSISINLIHRVPAILRMNMRSKETFWSKYKNVKSLINMKEIQIALSLINKEDNYSENEMYKWLVNKKYFRVFCQGMYMEYRFIVGRMIKNICCKQ